MDFLKTNAILRIASIITFFLIWHIASIFVDIDLLPGPSEVSKKIVEEAQSSELFSYFNHTQKSNNIFYYCHVYRNLFWTLYGKK